MHGCEPFGVTAGFRRYPHRRIGAKFRELGLERRLDRARVGFSVEAQQPRLVEIESARSSGG
ncbi:MAG TPA: hypothetical protein VJT10_10165 [Steroidobacteraceae bacterium]|nr:hypothetical protein [Steroidobacteraceae bacterium]